ncbi:MAG: hypothetical protein AB8I08_37715 [Sandaracinaceae bacterium]
MTRLATTLCLLSTRGLRPAAAALAFLFLLGAFASTADAQRRRRRRRRRPPPPPAEVETPAEDEEAAAEETPPAEADAPPAAETGAGQDVAAAEEDVPETPADAPTDSDVPPEPSTAPASEFDPGPAPPDVTPIRTDYVTLMDDLVQARMRVSALGNELFRTRLTVDLQDRTGDRQSLARIVVHVDGAPVFRSDGPVEGAQNGTEIFTGSLAPGPHVLTLELEQRARSDDAYRYTLQESFRFQVVRERLSEVTLILEDDSDMASSFPSGGEGRYEVRTRMRVATRALPSGG